MFQLVRLLKYYNRFLETLRCDMVFMSWYYYAVYIYENRVVLADDLSMLPRYSTILTCKNSEIYA